GTANHVIRKSELIDWKLVACTALGAAVAAWYGTELMRDLGNQQLSRIFGVLLILVGVRMLMMKAA
ncbi:MAG: TSUP family transporter, partial [Verrucomicrobiota bacterium]|nr:TSUP family transporter [Verrucomicrobiota bacterium]MEE2734473.1 TSUP family transporter [Verrucomicrobiota bacterium]